MNRYVLKDQKQLRCGYTTGTCATAAAKAAMICLFTETPVKQVTVTLPDGTDLVVVIENLEVVQKDGLKVVTASVKKDSGDDPDITNGILICATVNVSQKPGIQIDSGAGVGRVTKRGLEQPVGNAAINSVPRKMVEQAVMEICEEEQYSGGIDVIISVPEGEQAALKTFNPQLGIIGGISILGTTGIVEPMSEDAIKETIHTEVRVLAATGEKQIVFVPGNYGEVFVETLPEIRKEQVIKCSNYIGDALGYAAYEGFERILLIGHIGKLIKLSGGISNTHSKHGDARMELLCAAAIQNGISIQTAQEILNSVTTDEGIELLKREQLLVQTMQTVIEKAERCLRKVVEEKCEVGLVIFSNREGILGMNEIAGRVIRSAELTRKN